MLGYRRAQPWQRRRQGSAAVLGRCGPAKARAGNSSVIYYRVSDLGAAFATLSERGVHFESPPHMIARLPDHELWMAFFRDPDGNLLALMSEVGP